MRKTSVKSWNPPPKKASVICGPNIGMELVSEAAIEMANSGSFAENNIISRKGF